MSTTHRLESISDDELLRRLARLLRESRRVESELVGHIAEVDRPLLDGRPSLSKTLRISGALLLSGPLRTG
jgi:hypothetical protein